MIYAKDIHIYDNYIDNFRHKHKLEQDKKYKLPYMEQHFLRREKLIIDNKIEDVYLSTWNFKTRTIDSKRIRASIMEYSNSYVLMINHWASSKCNTIWYEGLDHIPTWEEIEQYVRSDF